MYSTGKLKTMGLDRWSAKWRVSEKRRVREKWGREMKTVRNGWTARNVDSEISYG
jgi:hypothetical protein